MSIRHLLMSAAILVAILIAPVRAVLAHELCFAGKTAYCLNDPFADYWEANGALPVFGYPITTAASEENADTGQPYLTQWLERNRMEDHPENAGTPYRVLLGLLGKERLAQLGRSIEAPEAGPKAGCLWFKETGLRRRWFQDLLGDPRPSDQGPGPLCALAATVWPAADLATHGDQQLGRHRADPVV
jgi:hypothetical protein